MTSFYPALPGRASSQLATSRLLFQIHHDQNAILRLQTQLSTGRRIERPSQDPGAAIRALAAQRHLEYREQLDTNLKAADTILTASESTLAQAQSIITEMRGIAVLVADTTLSAAEVDAYANQIEAAIDKMVQIGNSKFRDQYIFGGSNVTKAPLERNGDVVRFTGNNNQLLTIADYSATVAANVTASDAFGAQSKRVVGSIDLNPALNTSTPLANLHLGDGIRRGAISLSDGMQAVSVDLANAHNLQDVIDRIEAVQVSGRPLDVTLSVTGINIAYADGLGGLLRIDDVGSGRTASDLGINNMQTAGLSPVVGSDLNPRLTMQTRISQLLGGTGITAGDSFVIRQGSRNFTINTNGLNTVEDLLNRIQSTGAKVATSIDPSGRFLQLQSTESGSLLSIGENGSNLATRLGLRTFTGSTPVSSLNLGQGIFTTDQSSDLQLTRSDGTQFQVNLTGVQNINDVIARINNHVDNFDPARRIVASMATTGNGLVLTAPQGAGPIRVSNVGASQAGWGLGLVPRSANETVGTNVGLSTVITGGDVSGVEVESIFSSLIRMRQALEQGKSENLQEVAASLDRDLQRMSVARGLVGSRQQSIDRHLELSATQQLQLKEIESDELDVDLAQTISELTGRNAALQASLQLMGQVTRQSLFDYL
jgi:flagellar hook-associated protein 3 FlgL